jgi:hypothetical protein
MLRVGFEPMISVFEQAKTFHALDRAANDFLYVFKLLKKVPVLQKCSPNRLAGRSLRHWLRDLNFDFNPTIHAWGTTVTQSYLLSRCL